MVIPSTPPSAPAQMVVTLSASDNVGGNVAEDGLLQSSSVSDSSSTEQVESTLSTVPATVRDGPLLNNNNHYVIKIVCIAAGKYVLP